MGANTSRRCAQAQRVPKHIALGVTHGADELIYLVLGRDSVSVGLPDRGRQGLSQAAARRGTLNLLT